VLFGSREICNGDAALTIPTFNQTVARILSEPKVIYDSVAWRDSVHGDYASSDLRVIVPSETRARVRLMMTAHTRRLPRKCGFLLVYGERIFALDVNPGRAHNNKTAKRIITSSHWTTWPCDVAEQDLRDMLHVQWFTEFLTRTNTQFLGKYERPPYMSEQLNMYYDE